MAGEQTLPIGPVDASARPFRTVGLVELFNHIVDDSDRGAIREFLEYRRIFRWADGDKPLSLPEYLYKTWTKWNNQGGRVATKVFDRAYDLTLDKFTSLPGTGGKGVGARAGDDATGPASRVDCRKYYAALLRNIEEDETFCTASGALEQDHVVAVKFQKFVNHHFHLSYLEALRQQMNPFISRYSWCVDGKGTITVWMPKYLKGRERRAWLEKHVDNPDPERLGERERIQDIIDEKLAIPRFVPIDMQCESGRSSGFPAPNVEADRKMRPNFVAFLAREKALSADLQRPAIRRLGFEKIERLVNIVVPNLVTRERTDEDIAREFGLSKTAQSHFCGSE